jgi:dipeptidyl aminopeptidase/acylaminoacyl peptidase
MLVHGGPHWQWFDGWRPEVPAWVDHGFAVALVNYRGSTGYGARWRDALTGSPGFTELEDLVAGVDDLVSAGIADPERVVLAGRSWGGYLTLLGLGRHPDRWAVGDAVVPVADYVAAFEDEAPGLKALDKMLFGGTPDDRPDLYRERSPITYIDDVHAPVLLIAGDNDSRCPIRQILNYVDALERVGTPHRFHRYDAGHGSLVIDERVEHMHLELEFVLAHLSH